MAHILWLDEWSAHVPLRSDCGYLRAQPRSLRRWRFERWLADHRYHCDLDLDVDDRRRTTPRAIPLVAKAFEVYSGEKDVNCVPSGVTNLSNNEPVFLCTGEESGGSAVPCAPMVWNGKKVYKPDVNGAFDTGNGTFSC